RAMPHLLVAGGEVVADPRRADPEVRDALHQSITRCHVLNQASRGCYRAAGGVIGVAMLLIAAGVLRSIGLALVGDTSLTSALAATVGAVVPAWVWSACALLVVLLTLAAWMIAARATGMVRCLPARFPG